MKKIETNILEKKYWFETPIEFSSSENSEWNVVKVYPSIENQCWYGMGGSITEASAFLFSKLSKSKQKEFLDAYFSSQGLNYDLGRLSIGSNDFSLSSYQYQNSEKESFDVSRDQQYIIPFLKSIYQRKNLTLVASPWSPPDFMKSNFQRENGGFLKKECYEEYVDYLLKFIDVYKSLGITISYLTIQNEPFANQVWESCIFTLEEQKDFIENYLLPKMKDDLSLLLWDHNKDHLLDVVHKLDINSSKVKGIAFHNYTGIHEDNLKLVHERYPNYLLFHTEGCTGFSFYDEQSWVRDAEYYLIDLIKDMNHGLNGYIDWNLLLDFHGGPNHKENYCKSAIILNEEQTDFYKTPIYYYLGHIARFFKVGTILCPVSIYRPDLFVVAGKEENGVVVTILNVNNYEIPIHLDVLNYQFDDVIKSHTIVTYCL